MALRCEAKRGQRFVPTRLLQQFTGQPSVLYYAGAIFDADLAAFARDVVGDVGDDDATVAALREQLEREALLEMKVEEAQRAA